MNSELLKIADDIRQNCNFIIKSDEHLYNISKHIYQYLYETHKQPNYLIKLCALIVKKNKKATTEVLEYSKIALLETQHPDSVVYYCKSLLLNKDKEKDKEYLLNAFLELKNIEWESNNTRTIVDIFEACFYHSLCDYKFYTKTINKFNREKPVDFNPYISIPVSSVYYKEVIEISPVKNDVIGQVTTSYPNIGAALDYCISVSCDKKYFDIYGNYLINSLKKLSDNFYCHISITDNVDSIVDDARFAIINQNISSMCNIGPISSSLRFIHALDLLKYTKTPVIVLDFDCVVMSSLKPLLELGDADVGLRILENSLPWEKYTGGMSIYLENDKSKEILEGVNQYLLETISNCREQWWIDQNALEIAIRSSQLKDHLKIKNIFKEITKYIYLPTGTRESKLLQMNKIAS